MYRSSAERYLLAADIGGTKTNIVLAVAGAERSQIVAQRFYASQDHPGLDAILDTFLNLSEVGPRARHIVGACLAVAGPVEAADATLTNLGWRISSTALSRRFGIGKVELVNDFAAAGLGIDLLASNELAPLQSGRAVEHGARVVMGAGTGLGVCLLTWGQGRYAAHSSEAGHADFAPANEVQDGLLAHLRRQFGRVSYERVLSGPGLAHILEFLRDSGAGRPSDALLAAAGERGDLAAAITEFALSARDPLAVRALDLFTAIYGAFAGNMALTMLTRGGVYISGGIGPKIAAKLKDGTFMRAFADKGRFRELLSTIPVRLVMNPQVGLYGALEVARRMSLGCGDVPAVE